MVVSTALFLLLDNVKLRDKVAVLESERERALLEVKQIREDLKRVQEIKFINATNPHDIYERLRSLGYIRYE